MVGVDLGTRIVRVDVSKIRRSADVLADIEVPLAPLEAPGSAALAEGSPSVLAENKGDHASALLTHDTQQSVDDLDTNMKSAIPVRER